MKICRIKKNSRQSLSRRKLEETPAMNKKLYRKVLKSLLSYHPKKIKSSKKRRIKRLASAICGLIRKKKPHMSALGSGIPKMMTAYSREKAMKTFLDNKWVDYQAYYLPVIGKLFRSILQLPEFSKSIRLVIDGSKTGSQHMTLMVSLMYKGRGIPFIWLVHKKPKGHFKSDVHIDLIQQAHQLINRYIKSTQQITLLGDGEFDSIDLQNACLSYGWNFVFRTACNSAFYENDVRFQPKDLAVDEKHSFLFIPNTEFTEDRQKNINFVYLHEQGYEEAIPLISNLEEPIDIIEAYKKRYSIECMFKDLKSTTYNVHKTRLRSIHAISNLIMVAALALILLIKVGVKYENSPHRKYIHRLRPDRVVHTIISYGRDFIDFCLDYGIAFNFSYKFSKNSS